MAVIVTDGRCDRPLFHQLPIVFSSVLPTIGIPHRALFVTV